MLEGFVKDFFAEGRQIFIKSILDLLPNKESFTANLIAFLPDLVGYTAIICGGFIMLSPMLNSNILKPFSVFCGVGIVAVSILGAV